MPRNGSGVYSLPAGLPANGETSNATDDILTPFGDLETDMNTARPVVAGGTGATSASAARTNLGLGTIATQASTSVDIDGGAIDGTVIGGTTPAAGTFTTGTITTADINGGNIDGTVIGASSAAAGTFTTGTITTADINGGNIDGTTIGATTAAAGTFSTLTSANAAITGGAINGTTVGGATPAAGTFNSFLTISATPQLRMFEDDQAADEGYYRFLVTTGDLYTQTRTDANGTGQNIWYVERGTGTAVAAQRWYTGGSERFGINDSGLRLGATGARIASFQATISDVDTEAPTSGAVVDFVAANTIGGFTWAAEQSTTTGTAIDFTGIPAGVSEIIVVFKGVSLTGTDDVLVQLGDSVGFETTGYTGGSHATGGASTSITPTNGYGVHLSNNTRAATGTLLLNHMGSNEWISSHSVSTGSATGSQGGGNKTLSAELTQVRITRDGTDTFDAGAVRVGYR